MLIFDFQSKMMKKNVWASERHLGNADPYPGTILRQATISVVAWDIMVTPAVPCLCVRVFIPIPFDLWSKKNVSQVRILGNYPARQKPFYVVPSGSTCLFFMI